WDTVPGAGSADTFTQGRSQTITRSISGIKYATSRPRVEVSIVISARVKSLSTRIAGEDISTSPILSARMHSIFSAVFQVPILTYLHYPSVNMADFVYNSSGGVVFHIGQ